MGTTLFRRLPSHQIEVLEVNLLASHLAQDWRVSNARLAQERAYSVQITKIWEISQNSEFFSQTICKFLFEKEKVQITPLNYSQSLDNPLSSFYPEAIPFGSNYPLI
jgi:hypothetical protein